MQRLQTLGLLAAGLLFLNGCAENTAPGNDRAAEKSSSKPPAKIAPAQVAVHEAHVSSVYPETMTHEEVGKAVQGRTCNFSYTGVGDPVVAIEIAEAGARPGKGVIKINGKMVQLQGPTSGDRDYVSGETTLRTIGVEVSINAVGETLDDAGEGKQRRDAALHFKLDGAEEVGFWGFYTCGAAQEPNTESTSVSNGRDTTSVEGAEIYMQARCFACHGGLGAGGAGPRFRGHKNLSEDKHVIKALLEGPGIMPSYFDSLTDEEIAAVSSHIRKSWGNDYGNITPNRVAEIRASLNESWFP